jgi:hypothetical protein
MKTARLPKLPGINDPATTLLLAELIRSMSVMGPIFIAAI